MGVFLVSRNTKYLILKNSIDGRYKLVDNKPDATAYDMCICDGKTINDVLWNAQAWFDIRPSEVEV